MLNQRRIVATSTCSLRQEPVNKIKTELVNFLEHVSSLHLGRLTVHRTIAIFTCHATGSCGVTMNTPGFKIRSNYLWKMSCIMQKSEINTASHFAMSSKLRELHNLLRFQGLSLGNGSSGCSDSELSPSRFGGGCADSAEPEPAGSAFHEPPIDMAPESRHGWASPPKSKWVPNSIGWPPLLSSMNEVGDII